MIKDHMNKALYSSIINHPQVVQSPIANYCLKMNIDGPTIPQIVPKLLLQVSVRELHNILASDPEDGVLKKARDAENNIFISDSTLSSIFLPQLKKCQHDTRSCVAVNLVYLPKVYIPHYYHGMISIYKTERSNPKLSKQKVWRKIKSHK